MVLTGIEEQNGEDAREYWQCDIFSGGRYATGYEVFLIIEEFCAEPEELSLHHTKAVPASTLHRYLELKIKIISNVVLPLILNIRPFFCIS